MPLQPLQRRMQHWLGNEIHKSSLDFRRRCGRGSEDIENFVGQYERIGYQLVRWLWNIEDAGVELAQCRPFVFDDGVRLGTWHQSIAAARLRYPQGSLPSSGSRLLHHGDKAERNRFPKSELRHYLENKTGKVAETHLVFKLLVGS